MAMQPTRPGTAPAGRATGAATPGVRGRHQTAPPRPAQQGRLRLLPGAGEHEPDGCPVVVFLGVGDDRRSRLAAALLTHRAGGRAQAVSISQTSVDPDPAVVEALAAIGVDLPGCRSWPPSPELLRRAAAVVVMGYDSQTLDELPHAEDWFIDDPTGKDAETLGYLRDAIDRQVQRLLARVCGTASPTPLLLENG
jgi:arsenate reductase (thioredoxin)